jgi:maltose O-acetyltransferase
MKTLVGKSVQKDKLILELKRSYWTLMSEMKEWRITFIFSIPGKIGDIIRKRYAIKHFKHCGKNLIIRPHVRIYNPNRLTVGNDVMISRYSYISAGGGITIGDRVVLSPFVKIWSINHNFDKIDIPILEQGWKTRPVIIEDDVWIAMNAIILPGTYIGKGAIIAAGTVLPNKSIKPYSIIAGNPGKIMGYRNLEKNSIQKDC